MKKICLMLLIVVSCGLSAEVSKPADAVNTFEFLKTLQAKNTSSVFNETIGNTMKSGQSCIVTCLNQFRSCIATAQGAGEWWYCELTYERCAANCGI